MSGPRVDIVVVTYTTQPFPRAGSISLSTRTKWLARYGDRIRSVPRDTNDGQIATAVVSVKHPSRLCRFCLAIFRCIQSRATPLFQ